MKFLNEFTGCLFCALLLLSSCEKKENQGAAVDSVTNVQTEVSDRQVTLLWDDPNWENIDIGGDKIEITFIPFASDINQPILVNKWVEEYAISGLPNDIEYTFSLTAINNSGKRSEAVNIKATPTQGDIFNSKLTYGEFTDQRDGKTYKTITIGNQTWFAENLAYEIPSKEETDSDIWEETGRIGAKDLWCYFNNNKEAYGKYGILYQWNAAKTACPDGWHLPSADDWDELKSFLSQNGHYPEGKEPINVAKALASQYGWKESSSSVNVGNNPATNNSSGFSALAASGRDGYSGEFNDQQSGAYLGERASWWTTSENLLHVQIRYIRYGSGQLNWDIVSPGEGYSVRCIKN